MVLLILSFMVMMIVLVLLVWYSSQERKKMAARLQSVATRQSVFISDLPTKFAFKKTSHSILERKISQYLRHRKGRENSFRLKLYRSGLENKVSRILGLATVMSGVLTYIISKFGLVDSFYIFPSGIIFGCFTTYLIINFLEQRFKNKIMEQMPLTMDILLRGIKSGSSVEKAFKIISHEVSSPLKEEFLNILRQIDFGISFDDALNETADRVDIPDFYFFCSALIIQRRAGGSLAEILENISLSLSRSSEIRGKIRALSSEAKATSYILGSLPIILWIIIVKVNDSYLNFFVYTESGHRLIMYVVGMIAMAFITIRQMIKIKV